MLNYEWRITDDEPRQSGRTTKQLENAKPDAVFIWPTYALYYPEKLAKDLGRTDITIISVGRAFSNCMEYFRGRRCSEIVVDHAIRISADAAVLLSACTACYDEVPIDNE